MPQLCSISLHHTEVLIGSELPFAVLPLSCLKCSVTCILSWDHCFPFCLCILGKACLRFMHIIDYIRRQININISLVQNSLCYCRTLEFELDLVCILLKGDRLGTKLWTSLIISFFFSCQRNLPLHISIACLIKASRKAFILFMFL